MSNTQEVAHRCSLIHVRYDNGARTVQFAYIPDDDRSDPTLAFVELTAYPSDYANYQPAGSPHWYFWLAAGTVDTSGSGHTYLPITSVPPTPATPPDAATNPDLSVIQTTLTASDGTVWTRTVDPVAMIQFQADSLGSFASNAQLKLQSVRLMPQLPYPYLYPPNVDSHGVLFAGQLATLGAPYDGHGPYAYSAPSGGTPGVNVGTVEYQYAFAPGQLRFFRTYDLPVAASGIGPPNWQDKYGLTHQPRGTRIIYG